MARLKYDIINGDITDEQIIFVTSNKNGGMTYPELTKYFNEKYGKDFPQNLTERNIRSIYDKYNGVNLSELKNAALNIELLKKREVSNVRTTHIVRENREVVKGLLGQDAFFDALKRLVNDIKIPNITPRKIPSKQGYKKGMTLEAMFSDIHYGKLTKTFNYEICRSRMQEYTKTIIQELEINGFNFNIDEVILNFLGDIIESATMHGLESLMGCEFGNSEQIEKAIKSIFEDTIIPIAVYCQERNIKTTFIGIAGNHDRTEPERTFNLVGKHNVTWIIYHSLKMLCEHAKLNVTFHIPEGNYLVYPIYKDKMLCEHYDVVKSNTSKAMNTLLDARSKQAGVIINFMRGGHFHEYNVYGRGKIIVNGSLCGEDSYSKTLGFMSEPIQVINLYCETENRPTSFYKSFPVYLGVNDEK